MRPDNVISVRLLQFAKTRVPSVATRSGIVTSERSSHPLNEDSPIETTLSGMLTDVSSVQAAKAFPTIFFVPSLMENLPTKDGCTLTRLLPR